MSQKTNRIFSFTKINPGRLKAAGAALFSIGILLTLHFFVIENYLWKPIETWNLSKFIPNSDEWREIPFFYTIGSWPRRFAGHPVFYRLPYEKGPPFQFIGHITARWSYPDIQLTFEGPKTPQDLGDRNQIKSCFKSSLSFECFNLRRKTLSRHIAEIQNRMSRVKIWDFRWFAVDNPDLPPEDQVQGIYLMAKNGSQTQDRFILIQSSGIHQTLILEHPNSHEGQIAFETLTKALGTLRNYRELTTGRSKINHDLELVNLAKVNELTDSNQILDTFADIQSLLISKISVDPAHFESYFHLAGTAYLMNKNKNSPQSEIGLSSENVKSATQFALDIAPKDPKTFQIQRLVLDLRL